MLHTCWFSCGLQKQETQNQQSIATIVESRKYLTILQFPISTGPEGLSCPRRKVENLKGCVYNAEFKAL